MNRATSIYLDTVRIAAALAVFLGHASWQQLSGGLLWQMQGHGREAVDVFFVLSGFVVFHVTTTRETGPLDYAVHRLARLWSVAVPALLATFVLDEIGRSLRPELYRGWCCDIAGSTAWQFFGGFVFLSEIWSHHTPPGSDMPYWSLGFEAWYYAVFGLALFVRRPWHLLAALAVLVAVGPGIAVLFPLWLLGLFCSWLSRRRLPGPRFGAVLWAGSLLLFAFYESQATRGGELYDAFAFTAARWHDYLQDYAVGLLFAANLLGFIALSQGSHGLLDRIGRPMRWLAGATFTLYLFHLPLMHLFVAAAPWPVGSWPTRALVFLATPLAALALAELTERRKTAWRHAILALARVLGFAAGGGTAPVGRRWSRPS